MSDWRTWWGPLVSVTHSLSPLYWSLFNLFPDYADCYLNECYCHQWSCARWAEFSVFVFVCRHPEDGHPVVLHGQLATVHSTAPYCAEISSAVDACLSLCLFEITVTCRCASCVKITFQEKKNTMTAWNVLHMSNGLCIYSWRCILHDLPFTGAGVWRGRWYMFLSGHYFCRSHVHPGLHRNPAGTVSLPFA